MTDTTFQRPTQWLAVSTLVAMTVAVPVRAAEWVEKNRSEWTGWMK